MMAAGKSKPIAIIRYFRFCLKLGNTSPLFSLLNRLRVVIVPRLRAAASPNIRAGISMIPWGSKAANTKPRDAFSTAMVDTRASIQPLTVKVIIGIRQNIGLRAKLKSRTEAFLTKMSIARRMGGSETNMLPNSSRVATSSKMMLVMLDGVAKPNIRPMANNEMAIKIHLLYFISAHRL